MAAFVEALRAHRIKPYRTKSHRTKAHCAKLHYSKSTVQNCTAQNCFAQKSHCAVLHCAAVQNHTNTNAKKHGKRRAPKSSEHAASAVRFLFLTVLSCFIAAGRSVDYLAVALAESAGSIRLVGIEMYCGCKIRIYTDNKVAENCGSAETVVYAERYYLLVLNAELLCSCGIKVNMALCNDNALLKVKLAAGTDQLASGSACNVAALANVRASVKETST